MKKRLNRNRKLTLSLETLGRLTGGDKGGEKTASGYISCDGVTCAVVSCAGSCFEIC